ncbi:diiron oxygenase [Nocardia asiatica]|uniref:diiron oxygenase n=1 Tax=Nocardia asiatica TaxID=209252 RepID=UPI0005C13FE4|nr:diiron oxygenase [Nocardia asiatica]
MSDADSRKLFDSLLASARRLSFDPRQARLQESAPSDGRQYGMTPEWSPLFGTPIWQSLSETDRARLTRREVTHFLGVAIWLELSLQVALLRLNYSTPPNRPDMQFLLNECADENMHSLMFVGAIDQLGTDLYELDRSTRFFGWMFRMLAWEEVAYGVVLAGEEIFDVMQRDWMATDGVAEVVRKTSYIHVVEESRHMAFARRKVSDRMAAASALRRWVSTVLIAIGAHVVAKALINRQVYEGAELDWTAVKASIDSNEHHKMMFRTATAAFIDFQQKARLMNRTAHWIYRKSNLA